MIAPYEVRNQAMADREIAPPLAIAAAPGHRHARYTEAPRRAEDANQIVVV